jgi:hypothetical protein
MHEYGFNPVKSAKEMSRAEIIEGQRLAAEFIPKDEASDGKSPF